MKEEPDEEKKRRKEEVGNSRKTIQVLKNLFAGGVAGAISRTCVSPLERVKILYQIQISSAKDRSLRETFKNIYQKEGFRGFLNGNGANIVRIVPYSAIQFASYEFFTQLLSGTSKENMTSSKKFLAGAFAGICSILFTYPLDLIRTRISAPVELQRHRGIINSFIGIVKEEGYGALFKGIGPTLMGVAPYVGLNFLTYETCKKFLLEKRKQPLFVIDQLGCGAVAGFVGQTMTYPLDVLRRRMQMQGFSQFHPSYSSTFDCMKKTYQLEGVSGFFRGLIPNYLKVVPSISISFASYEIVKNLIKDTK